MSWSARAKAMTVAIESGLAPGEVVVIEGVDKLQRGMKVAARLAGASNTKGN